MNNDHNEHDQQIEYTGSPTYMNHETLVNDVNQWNTCCGGKSSDRRLLIFVANLSTSLILMLFSLIRLCDNSLDISEKNIYIGFVSLVVGIWVKSS
jgi:hypothetical protein